MIKLNTSVVATSCDLLTALYYEGSYTFLELPRSIYILYPRIYIQLAMLLYANTVVRISPNIITNISL